MPPYYYDDGDDGESIGRRLLAGLRPPEGPDETAQAPRPPMTMGEYQSRTRPQITPPFLPSGDTDRQDPILAGPAGIEGGLHLGGGDATPRRMQQPVSMVGPQPTLSARNSPPPEPGAGPEAVSFPPRRSLIPRIATPKTAPAAPRSALDIITGSITPVVPTLGTPDPAPGTTTRGAADYRRLTSMSPQPSMVSALPPAPEPPAADPRRAAALDTISSTSAPIAKTDAAGKTLPQYRMGLGQRILRGAAATLGHGVPGLAEVITNPNDPNYIGRGATNAQYAKEEALRKARLQGATEQQSALDKEAALQERDFQNRNTQYRDEARGAAQQDVLNERQSKDEAMAKSREEISQIRADYEKLREEAEKYKEENSNITYDDASSKFMANGHVFTPKSVEQGAVLEAREGIDGPYTKLWKSERRNNVSLSTHEPKWSKENAALIMAWARAHNLRGATPDEITSQMSPQDIQQALSHVPTGGETFINPGERQEFNRRTAAIDRQIEKAEKDASDYRAIIAQPANDPQTQQAKTFAENALRAAEAEVTRLEGQKQTIQTEIVGRRPQTAAPATGATAPAGRSRQPVTPQGQPPPGNPNGYKKPNGQFYQHVYKNGDQRLGSDDGKAWYDVKTGRQFNAGAQSQKKTP